MAKPKQRPVAVFDIDGTIFRSSLLIELVEELLRHQALPAHVKEEYLDSHQQWLRREGSYENYINDVVTAFVRHTIDLEQVTVLRVAKEVVGKMSKHTYRYTRELITELGKTHFLLAISGSPIEIVEAFSRQYGFDATVGTMSQLENGRFNGNLWIGAKDKDQTLQRYVRDYDLTLEGSVGVGDSESDAAFLELVEQPIAFNPNSRLLATAREKHWQIVVERKDVIYSLQSDGGAYVLA